MTQRRYAALAASLLVVLIAAVAPAQAQTPELIGMLTSQLGVTEAQAAGGAGSIFGLAKQNLSAADFRQVAGAVPGMDTLLGAAPKAESALPGLGAATSLLGGQAGTATGLASLSGSFSKLGMSSGLVTQFVPIVLQYVQSSGGDSVMNLLKGALQ